MKETVSTIVLFMSLLIPAAAFVVFWVGKIVNLRKEIIELQMRQGFQQQTIDELKKDVDDLQKRN